MKNEELTVEELKKKLDGYRETNRFYYECFKSRRKEIAQKLQEKFTNFCLFLNFDGGDHEVLSNDSVRVDSTGYEVQEIFDELQFKLFYQLAQPLQSQIVGKSDRFLNVVVDDGRPGSYYCWISVKQKKKDEKDS